MKKLFYIFLFIASTCVMLSFKTNEVTYKLSGTYSNIVWFLNSADYILSGAMKVKEGYLLFKNGQLSSGKVVIDINSMDVSNPKEKNLKTELLTFLKGEHFLNSAKYPDIVLNILSADYLDSRVCRIKSTITINNKTSPLELDAVIRNQTSRAVLLESDRVTIDKQKFNIMAKNTAMPSSLKDIISNNAALELEISQLIGLVEP